MRKFLKLFLVLFVIMIVTVATNRIRSGYPDSWTALKFGDKRLDLYKSLGDSETIDLWDVKSDIWIEDGFFGRWSLQVNYDQNQRLRKYWVFYYLGTNETFKRFTIKTGE